MKVQDLKQKISKMGDDKDIILELAYFGGEYGDYNELLKGKCSSIDITDDALVLYGDADENPR